VQPRRGAAGGDTGNSCGGAAPKLLYYGGPVIQDPHVVNVNWSSLVSADVQAKLPTFYTDVFQSGYLDWLSEYETVGLRGQDGAPGSNQAIVRGSLVGSYTLVPSRCPGDDAACTVTEPQIQDELRAQIAAGHLPEPTVDCSGFVDTLYMINFPPNLTINIGDDGCDHPPCTQCGAFCGLHGSMKYGPNGIVVPYSVLPDLTTPSCMLCAPADHSNTVLQNTTSVASHELIEAITDPEVDQVPTNTRPVGWIDPRCDEVADICMYRYGTVTAGADTWTVTEVWSNQANACLVTQRASSVCDAPNPPAGCRKCSCIDDGSASGCEGTTPRCETSSTNVHFGHCVACTDSAQCSAGQVCQNTSAPATDDTCATCGAAGQPCCASNVCAAGACKSGTCCVAKTSCDGGQSCGTQSDGCGGTITCGTCALPQTCGAVGTPGRCGCAPKTSCEGGQNCGSQSEGCGGTIPCGTCKLPQTCAGGGDPGRCGCTPKTSCEGGQNCGTQSDGCGGTIPCGTCKLPQTCAGGGDPGRCGCTPRTSCTGGQNCGTASDGCGGTIACGTCAPPQTCGAGGQCVCVPRTTCSPGATCGEESDLCGGVVVCGTCKAHQTCAGNTCVDDPVDSGPPVTDSGSDAEGAPDAEADAAKDADVDAPADASTEDAAMDATPDVGTDAGIDATPDAGNDAGVDAGLDAEVDAEIDAAPTPDAAPPEDAGAPQHDAGPTSHDAGLTAGDAGTPQDAAALDAATDATEGEGPIDDAAGCGCRTAGASSNGPAPALLGVGVLAVAARFRRRRRAGRASA
jgi:MYXO-CTERM domain-containing protein